MSESFLHKLRLRLVRRAAEHSVRESIAELVQEAADAPQTPGVLPELDRQERALIANVLRLRGTTADDVMVPRADIVAIPVDTSLDQALDLIRREGHSRMPVFREQLDDIVGMVHIKDVFAYVGRPDAFQLEAVVRKPLMVAPQIPVLDLLLQMRQARMHLALVVDEYGGIDGLVTIEDLVETITGDIADEHDEVDTPLVTERPDGTLDIDARLLTEEERAADIDTVGGLIFTLAGRVPPKGEVVTHHSGMEFRVLDADPRRIRRLRAKLPAAALADAAE
jgi:magnesium and cobalt transporter